MLVIHGPSWFPIVLCSNNHGTAPICGGTDWYRSNNASPDIVPEGLLYFFPVVVWYWNGVMFGFGDCTIFERYLAHLMSIS